MGNDFNNIDFVIGNSAQCRAFTSFNYRNQSQSKRPLSVGRKVSRIS